MEVFNRLPGRCHHILKLCWKTSAPRMQCTGTTFESQGINEPEKGFFLGNRINYMGSRILACNTWHIDKSDSRDLWSTIPHQFAWAQSILSLCIILRRWIPICCKQCPTFKGQVGRWPDCPLLDDWTNLEMDALETHTPSTPVKTDTDTIKSERTFHALHRSLWQASRGRVIAGAA